jgi:hypothetical protein
MYEGINRANYMVENSDKMDFPRKNELYGEVHFLRAFFYFELTKFFGDVPLFTTSRLTAGDSATLSRSPQSEVYALIESDLQAAISALPLEKSTNGRATSLTTFFVVFILFIFGGEVLKGLSFALIIGVVLGTYSSLFVASPLVLELDSKSKK